MLRVVCANYLLIFFVIYYFKISSPYLWFLGGNEVEGFFSQQMKVDTPAMAHQLILQQNDKAMLVYLNWSLDLTPAHLLQHYNSRTFVSSFCFSIFKKFFIDSWLILK